MYAFKPLFNQIYSALSVNQIESKKIDLYDK